MKRRLAFITLAVATVLLAVSGVRLYAQQQNGKEGDELVGLVGQWLDAEAHNDTAALGRLIADDFIGTAFGGHIVTKDDIVPRESSAEGRFPKSTLKESTFRLFGNTGVVMGQIALDSQPNSTIRFTVVFMKRQAGWQMVAAHLAHDVPAQ